MLLLDDSISLKRMLVVVVVECILIYALNEMNSLSSMSIMKLPAGDDDSKSPDICFKTFVKNRALSFDMC